MGFSWKSGFWDAGASFLSGTLSSEDVSMLRHLDIYFHHGILLLCDLIGVLNHTTYKISTLVNPTLNLNQPSDKSSAAILFLCSNKEIKRKTHFRAYL